MPRTQPETTHVVSVNERCETYDEQFTSCIPAGLKPAGRQQKKTERSFAMWRMNTCRTKTCIKISQSRYAPMSNIQRSTCPKSASAFLVIHILTSLLVHDLLTSYMYHQNMHQKVTESKRIHVEHPNAHWSETC